MAGRGNPHPTGSKPDKLMRDAIILALHRTAKGGKSKKLNKIAEKLVELAEAGDMAAIKEVNDRCDGKAVQAIEHGGTALEELLDALSGSIGEPAPTDG